MAVHPVDLLTAVTAPDEINLMAAFINVVRENGTVLGMPPSAAMGDSWTVAICHRWVLSLKHAYTSGDSSGEVWRRFVTAWERGHLDRTG